MLGEQAARELARGSVALIWIVYRLLLPTPEDSNNAHGNGPTGFWGAMRTIVVADAVMGLENVLGVAGAAQGSHLLVVLGRNDRVPIVVWGSRLLLRRWVERSPVIIYFGATVLAWTAVKTAACRGPASSLESPTAGISNRDEACRARQNEPGRTRTT